VLFLFNYFDAKPKIKNSKYKREIFCVVCARAGGANTTTFLLAALFAKRKTKFGGGGKIGIGKRGRAKIPFPRPFSFLPARAKNQKFFSKMVRVSV